MTVATKTRLSRKQAVFMAADKSGIAINPDKIIRINGKDLHALYRENGQGRVFAVVTREWQLPLGNWTYLAHVGRYIVFTHKDNE
jgi:hypothetical protein